jgi:hypothetical protein
MTKSRPSDSQILLTVGDAAVIFAPAHFGSVGVQVGAGDMVVRADLGATEAAHLKRLSDRL